MKILLVDDKEDVLYMLETLLKSSGHEVVCAKNGLEALDRLRKNNIEMIVSDILMPKMDGYRLCRECKKDSRLKGLPFVFMTSSYTQKKDEQFALSLGAERFIRRPIEPEEFIRAIEDVIKKQREGVSEKREEPTLDELSYLTEHNERLLNKLEQKVFALEKDIDERKRIEDELRDSEEKYRTFLRHFQGIAFRGTLDFVPVFFHGQVEEITGYTPEEFIAGKPAWDKIIHPDDYALIAPELEKIRTEPLYLSKREYRIIRKDGGIRLISETIQNICNESGNPVAVQGALYDVTESRRTEQELSDSEEKFRTITLAAHDAIIMMGNEGEILFWNNAAANIFGYSDKEVIGKELHTFLAPPRYHDAHKKGFERFRTTGEGAAVGNILELAAIRQDGEEFPIELSVSAVRLKGRWHAIGVLRDITGRKTAEKALQESENKYRILLENLPQKIFQKDRNSIYVSCNGNYADDLKIKSGEIAGKTDYEFFPKELAEKYRSDDKRLMESGKSEDIKEKYIQNGKDVWVHTVKTPIWDENGNVTGILGVFWDITEQKRKEEEHARLQEQLRQSQKLEGIGQLAGGIAHDFNNILSAIIGFGSLAHLKLPSDSPLQYYINEVLAAGNRGASLTQQILAFCRKQTLDIKVVDLSEIVTGIKNMLLRLMREDISIKFVLSDAPLTILADISQIDQILLNLTTNARDAMPKGGDLIISTSIADIADDFISAHGYGVPGRYAFLTVSDTGTGMDKTTQNKIFEPFFTTKEAGKGTGLGLSVVYGIVKQHNGFIAVDSELGKGSTFRVYFPLISSESGKAQAEGTLHVQGGSETILLADDDECIKNYLTGMLEHFGYKVTPAENGDDAVDKFMKNRDEIKLLVLDIMMPFKGGRETYDEITKIRPDIKAIFMSGHSGDVIAMKRIAEDGLDFIAKPFKPEEFLGRVREILDRK